MLSLHFLTSICQASETLYNDCTWALCQIQRSLFSIISSWTRWNIWRCWLSLFFVQQCLLSTQYCIRLQTIHLGNMDNFQQFIPRNLKLTGKGGKKPFRIGHIQCGSDLIYFLIFLLFFPIIWKDYSSHPLKLGYDMLFAVAETMGVGVICHV